MLCKQFVENCSKSNYSCKIVVRCNISRGYFYCLFFEIHPLIISDSIMHYGLMGKNSKKCYYQVPPFNRHDSKITEVRMA